MYLGVIRQVLDYAEVEPNPARSRKVRLPAQDAEKTEPPNREHFVTVLRVVSPKYRLPLRVIEGTGLHVGELTALRWGL